MKKALFVGFLFVNYLATINAQIKIISSPVGYQNRDYGYVDTVATIGTTLYMQYLNNSGSYDLAKYDGTTLTIIPAPVGYQQNGYFGIPIVIGTTLYMQYLGDDGNFDLAKYDGTTLTIIPSPAGYENDGKGYIGIPIVMGTTLYIRYYDNTENYDLAKYDGTTLTMIPSPVGYQDTGKGYIGDPIILGTTLYMRYGRDKKTVGSTITNLNYDLAKYDGTTLTIIPSIVGYKSSGQGYTGASAILGTMLYMSYKDSASMPMHNKYDGTSTTYSLVSSGSSGFSVNTPIVLGTTLYTMNVSSSNSLAKFNGTTYTIVPNPSGSLLLKSQYVGDPLIVGANLYMRYRGDYGDYRLAKYDGATLTTTPPLAGIASKTIYQNKQNGYIGTPTVIGTTLYIHYVDTGFNSHLAKYDGVTSTFTIIPNPVGYQNKNAGYVYSADVKTTVIGTTLYMQFLDSIGTYHLAKYDGTALTIIPNPEGYTNLGYADPMVIGSTLYLRYYGTDENFDLAKYDGTKITIIHSPVGYDNQAYGYWDSPVAIGNTLYMRYYGNDGNFDLAKYDNSSCVDADVPTLSPANSVICIGNTANITINIATGHLNDATNWQWYTGGCGVISAGSGASLVVSPTVTTTYYVRGEGGCVAIGACGSITITVNNTPSTLGAISGLASVCLGTSNTYSITSIIGATAYNWSLPSGWAGSSSTNRISTIASATSGNISVTASNNCGTSAAVSKAITVNSIPATPGTISGLTPVCVGTTNAYNIVAVAGATSYNWSVPTGWAGSSSTTSIPITVSAGSGAINVTASNNCGTSAPALKAITVSAIDTSKTVNGRIITSNQAGALYQWIDCATLTNALGVSTNKSYSVTATGSYAVVVTIGTCSDTSACTNLISVGINEMENDQQLTVYPNPTKGSVTVNSAIMPDLILVTNILGNKVLELIPFAVTTEFTLEGLTSGIYFVKVISKTQSKTIRVVKIN